MITQFAPSGPTYDDLDRINWEVNSNPKLRDCQFFTVFKGNKLRAMGYKPQDVYVATPRARGDVPNHVVLRMGDWILDNLEKHPYPYAEMQKRYREYPGYKITTGGIAK